MAGRDRSKDASLAASRTLNPHPEAVTDPAFTSGAFFDPADLVQVKYEMVRAVEAGALGAGAAASAFGLARQSYYNARKALAEHGLPGLIPARPGPKGGHKLTAAVLDFVEQQAAADPAPSPAQLAAAIADQFGVTVHKRSVERALASRRAAGHERKEDPVGLFGGQAAVVRSSRWRWVVRVRSSGLLVHQASSRIRLIAAAAALCSRRVLSRPR